MAEQTGLKAHPWPLADLFTGDGGEYLRNPEAARAIILRGRDNWLNRFVSHTNAAAAEDAIREEVQALFARWLRMQNLCVLMGAGASYYVTKALNANLLDSAAKLLAGRRSEKTLGRVKVFASHPSDPDSSAYSVRRIFHSIRSRSRRSTWSRATERRTTVYSASSFSTSKEQSPPHAMWACRILRWLRGPTIASLRMKTSFPS
jgi:hypothetical protein